VRKHLGYSWDEWRALKQYQADYYWELMLEEILPDPDSAEGWDDWADDPNVVRG
jgi:hypothetical protein